MSNTGKIVLGVATVAVVGAIGYGVYKHSRPDYIDDFEDDLFDDEDYDEEEHEVNVEDLFETEKPVDKEIAQ